MTLKEVKAGLLDLMKTIFPAQSTEMPDGAGYHYYSMAVSEGMKRPCFFTQLKPVDMSSVNYNTRNNDMTFYITYFQEEIDEEDMLDVIQSLRDLFGLDVKIGDRYIKVSDFSWDFVGTERNVLEISVSLNWMDEIEHNRNTQPLMETAVINQKLEVKNHGNA